MHLHALTSLPNRYDDTGALTEVSDNLTATPPRGRRHHRCSHPGTCSPGAVACGHDNRPLLGLVTVKSSKTSLDSCSLVALQRGQSLPSPIQRYVSPCQTMPGVYHCDRRGEDLVQPRHKTIAQR